MDDAVHGYHIQQLGGAVHQVGNIDRDGAQPAVGDGTLPEGVQGVLIFQPGDQGFDLVHSLDWVAVELDAVLDLQHLELDPVRFQAVPGGLDGVKADVAVDEPAAQFAGHRRRDATAAEEVRHQHPLVGGGFDDALQECNRFLRSIVVALFHNTTEATKTFNIGPHVLNRFSRHFIQVSFILRNCPRSGLDNSALCNQLFHSLTTISPIPANAHDFIIWIPFRGTPRALQII